MKSGSQGSGSSKKNKGQKMRAESPGHSPMDSRGQLDLRVQTEIGKRLRAIYDDVINEPVPNKFMELLEKLERSTTQKN
jgi:Anti-sigma factor NepR